VAREPLGGLRAGEAAPGVGAEGAGDLAGVDGVGLRTPRVPAWIVDS
jgi:hypothetical protein